MDAAQAGGVLPGEAAGMRSDHCTFRSCWDCPCFMAVKTWAVPSACISNLDEQCACGWISRSGLSLIMGLVLGRLLRTLATTHTLRAPLAHSGLALLP